jgi:hypothetical protein
MKKPNPRPSGLPRRLSDNNKRRLRDLPIPNTDELRSKIRYVGSSKHKANPHLFGLPPYIGARGDATLCDAHSGFSPTDMQSVPDMLNRGIRAGLIGENGELWTLSDSGWIFECRLTNTAQWEYHGYPVRGSDAMAELVFQRFASWTRANGDSRDEGRVRQCRALYGFKL